MSFGNSIVINMGYTLTRDQDIFSAEDKAGVALKVFGNIGDCGVVIAQTDTGHVNEIMHKTSTFHYIILDGSGEFVIDNKKVSVTAGDKVSIERNTPFYYRGQLRLLLLTNPPWTEEGEVLVRKNVL